MTFEALSRHECLFQVAEGFFFPCYGNCHLWLVPIKKQNKTEVVAFQSWKKKFVISENKEGSKS